MSDQQRDQQTTDSVHHEAPVSETLKEGARNQREEAQGAAAKPRGRGERGEAELQHGEPLKQHGDALLTGTGDRHGVQEREDAPERE